MGICIVYVGICIVCDCITAGLNVYTRAHAVLLLCMLCFCVCVCYIYVTVAANLYACS